MICIASEKELRESFRPIDQAEIELPQEFKFPMAVKDFLTWTEPSGCRVYLLFQDGDRLSPLGIVFRQDSGGAPSPSMCEWCHSIRAGDGVRLLTAHAAANRRVGIHLCRDLSCRDKIESLPDANDFPLVQGPKERTRAILKKMSAFARRELF